MRVSLFGASGGIGRHVLEYALAAGHEVTAMVRDASRLDPADPSERAPTRTMVGDITNGEDVSRAIAGSDAVISALGPTSNRRDEIGLFETWANHLVDAMATHGVRRLVLLSGAAVTLPHERKAAGDRLASAVVRLFVRNVVAAKQRELEIVQASGLDWIAVRPPRVVEGPPTGRWEAGTVLRLGPRSRITQGDVGAFLVSQLTDDRWIRQAPYVSS